MMRRAAALVGHLGGWLVLLACASVAALAWIAYRAVDEWQRSATTVASQRAEEAADLLVTALRRDMRSVQASMLADRHFQNPVRFQDNVAAALARYPYPEVFFAWSGAGAADAVSLYARVERQPPWMRDAARGPRFPIVHAPVPRISDRLVARVAADAAADRPFSIFNIDLDGAAYQAVASIAYDSGAPATPTAVFGFLVNLEWVRAHYFQQLTSEVARIAAPSGGVSLAVLDAGGVPVTGGPATPDAGPIGRRAFELAFFDPLLTALDPPADLHLESWTAQAAASSNPALLAANVGARRTLIVAGITALVLPLSILFTYKAARASADLALMRSEFVSAVTHELKTPITTIRVISEALATGRGGSEASLRQFGQMAAQESKKLTRLVDNLLAYSRIADVTEAYAMEPVAVSGLVEASVKEFAAQLRSDGFDVRIDVPPDLPRVRVDRTACGLLLGNLVENAIRYSKERRTLSIRAHQDNGHVVVDVVDQGIGIPASELPYVTRKFYRGQRTGRGGSGLGLAIAERIVADHGGALTIRSAVDVGTTVSVALPADTSHEEAHPAG